MRLGSDKSKRLSDIALDSGLSVRALSYLFESYRGGGLTKVMQKNKGNGPESWLEELDRKFSGKLVKAFKKKLLRGSFRRAKDAQAWLKARYDFEVAENTVRKYMHKLGSKLKVLRPRHKKKMRPRRIDLKAHWRASYGNLICLANALYEYGLPMRHA